MTSTATRWCLAKVELFEPLSSADRQALERETTIMEVRRGVRLYAPGDPSNHLFAVSLGVVKLLAPESDDNTLLLGFVYPGDVFGEAGVVDHAPQDHIAEVHEDAIIAAIPADPLRHVLRETPELAHRMLRLMASRVRSAGRRAMQLGHRNAHSRIALTLLALANQLGTRVRTRIVIPLRLSQRDLANLVGVRRETVNLVMRDLAEQGLVETSRESISLNNPERLASEL